MLVGSVLAVIPFVVAVYGGPLVGRNPMCNVGTLHCCNKLDAQAPGSSSSTAPTGSSLLDLLNLNLSLPLLSQVGSDCSPIPVLAFASGAGCRASPACCTTSEDSTVKGLINFNCDPINIG